MGWFDEPTKRRATSWKEMSVEFRMMFVYQGCMMALFITGGALTVKLELLVAIALIAVGAAVSLRRRSEKKWHWRSPGAKGAAIATGTTLLMAFFLYSATPMFSPARPQFLPWYLAGFGIGAMAGIPSLFVLGFVIHFLLGVKLLDNAPTLRELLARRSGGGLDRS
jgi:hypothetical protein